eukprot:g764.t1
MSAKRKASLMSGATPAAAAAAAAATSEEAAPAAGGSSSASAASSSSSSSAKAPVQHPQKKHFRQRAHCNPLSHNDVFAYPRSPAEMDWSSHFDPRLLASERCTGDVEFADVGCGFGGLLVALAPLYPRTLMVGFEIRSKVSEYVRLRTLALREEHEDADGPETPPSLLFGNASVVRTNTMRYIANYFRKGQLKKLFFCFPDPHFKTKNHRRRIVTPTLLGEYAHILAVGGLLYCVTDVKELFDWMELHCRQHPCFEKLGDEELSCDPAVHCILNYTEEGLKVARQERAKYVCVFRRRPDEDVPRFETAADFWAEPDEKPATHVNNEDWRSDARTAPSASLPGMCMQQLTNMPAQ